MTARLTIVVIVCSIGCMYGQMAAGQTPPDDTAISLVRSSQEVIEEFHSDAPRSSNVVRVVYFHPRDREPLKQWRERLTRIIDDVREFYRDGFRRFGVDGAEIPFERDEAGYVFHLIQGKLPASGYDHASGEAIERELQEVLGEKIDFEREYVLTVHGLCHQEKDERFVFNAPYYGRGSQQNGFCHAADCELLDPERLKQKDERIVYTEHYYPRREQSIGQFNSWYIGGLAHELGHGLGLPHDAGTPRERSGTGFALMGSGNHHYREDLWGGADPAFLSLSSALQLLSHPLLTDTDHQRFVEPNAELETLEFSNQGKHLHLAGSIRSDVPAYAAVAYLWQPRSWPGDPQQDHLSIAHPTFVSKKQFDLKVADLRPGQYRLRFSSLHCNGAVSDFDFHLKVDRNGESNATELNDVWKLSRAESAVVAGAPLAREIVNDEAIRQASSREIKAKLMILHELLDPPEPVDLTTSGRNRVSLSDAKWTTAEVGWRKVARNLYDRERLNRNSIYLELKGRFYDKGLYAHSPSKFEFTIGRRWKTLTSTIGLRDGAAEQGSAIFEVLGDGKVLHRSPVLREGQSAELRVDVSNVQTLKLLTRGGQGHPHNSWAIWVDPILKR